MGRERACLAEEEELDHLSVLQGSEEVISEQEQEQEQEEQTMLAAGPAEAGSGLWEGLQVPQLPVVSFSIASNCA